MNRFEEIFRTAISLISERGFRGTSLNDIADKVGIKKPSLYHYFHSKEDLLYWIFLSVAEKIQRDFLKIQQTEPHPLKRIKKFIHCYLKYIGEDPKRFYIFLTEKRELSEEHQKDMEKICDLLNHLMKSAIIEAKEKKLIDKSVIPDLATFFIYGACNGTVVWFSPQGKYSIDQVADVFSSFVFKALGARDA